MKTYWIILFLICVVQMTVLAQWTRTGTTIYPTTLSDKVGIGTNTPIELLSVKRSTDGNIASFEAVNSGLTIQSNPASLDMVGYLAGVGYKPLFLRSGANGLWINTSGNLGIGTTTPMTKLDINGTGVHVMNFTNKIIDADYSDILSIRSATKGSVLNLVSSRTDAGALGGLVFTTTIGMLDSHANIAGIVGGRAGTDSYAGGYLSFWTKNGNGTPPQENMRITQSGHIGIGTTTPTGKLDINGSGAHLLNFTNKIIDADNADMLSIRSATKGSVLNLVSSRTDAGAVGGLVFTTTIGAVDSHANIAGIVGGRSGTDSYAGGHLSFWTKNGSGAVPRENVRITQEGNVGIGTNDPKGYKLAVAGKTITEEVVVKLQSTWPDYVFEQDYKLPSLSELEQYINTNKHLPEVPSAAEVKENGLSVGEMNAILLKKVEELTLYLIEQNKKIDQLQKANDEQDDIIKKCTNRN